jgi:hypothetical protein
MRWRQVSAVGKLGLRVAVVGRRGKEDVALHRGVHLACLLLADVYRAALYNNYTTKELYTSLLSTNKLQIQ